MKRERGMGAMLVTGATGLVGRRAVMHFAARGWDVKALVRQPGAMVGMPEQGVEYRQGDMHDATALRRAVAGCQVVVHCAAKVGDWGPIEDYRHTNVTALRDLLAASQREGVTKFVHISSLGVYPARDHFGTDETTPRSMQGIDGYTRTKIEAEEVVEVAAAQGLAAVILRPGFIYGPYDRSVLPRLLERLRTRQFAYLGDPTRLMNNTYVGNLVQAIERAISVEVLPGRCFNVTDPRLVTKREFVETIAQAAGDHLPQRVVPLGIARGLASLMERWARWRGAATAPVLSHARIKFLGLNLDFAIDRARDELGYHPTIDFREGMADTMAWFAKSAVAAATQPGGE